VLRGHEKGIRQLVHSEHNKLLVSCSFDFNILVWSLSVEAPIMKLSGHISPLLKLVLYVEDNCLLSCDVQGIIKIWHFDTY
jgi:WD40 repeat protein